MNDTERKSLVTSTMRKDWITEFKNAGNFVNNKYNNEIFFRLHMQTKLNEVLKKYNITRATLSNEIGKIGYTGESNESLKKYIEGKRFPKQKRLEDIRTALMFLGVNEEDCALGEMGYNRCPSESSPRLMITAEIMRELIHPDDYVEYLHEETSWLEAGEIYLCCKVMDEFSEIPLEKCWAICSSLEAYLRLEENSLHFLMRVQALDEEEIKDLKGYFSVFTQLSESQLSEMTSKQINDCQQILMALQNVEFSNTEKYNLPAARKFICEFIDNCTKEAFDCLWDNIDIYASLDISCFTLLIDFIALNDEKKQDMILLVADYLFRKHDKNT